MIFDEDGKTTPHKLMILVFNLFNRPLTLEKAKILFELEHGFIPRLRENDVYITQEKLDSFRIDYISAEELNFLLTLRDTGVVNIFMSPMYLENILGISREDARKAFKNYVELFEFLTSPENLL